MHTVRRYLYIQIVSAVGFVALAFLSLFFFIDFVEELQNVGREGYTLQAAFVTCLLNLPGHLYELIPIALLIGTIYTMSRLAQSSEFVILRTAGLGPLRALALLGSLGLSFAVLTFAVGDWVVPYSERQAALMSSHDASGLRVGGPGAWIRDTQTSPLGTREFALNINQMQPDGQFLGIRIYEFDANGQLLGRLAAHQGRIDGHGLWHLREVDDATWPASASASAASGAASANPDPAMQRQHLATMDWQSNLSLSVVSAAVLPLQSMSTFSLYAYMRHLSDHAQAGQRYELQFWKKAFYPLACLVMVSLALPFGYLQARDSSISIKVFGGILLGIAFVLLNNVTNHLGILQDWKPWLAAAAPSVIYMLMSMFAFSWLVRHR